MPRHFMYMPGGAGWCMRVPFPAWGRQKGGGGGGGWKKGQQQGIQGGGGGKGKGPKKRHPIAYM